MAGQAWVGAPRALAPWSAAAKLALLRANVRYWPSVFPGVRRELAKWDRRAQEIPDATLREQAVAKLREERFNTEVAATLATRVPRARRRTAVAAIVALEVMYDYLDGLTEQPARRPLANGRQLYRAFADATACCGPLADYYRHHPQHDDGGYLAALVTTCRYAMWSLPAAQVVAPAIAEVLARCGEAQTRTHAVAQLGAGQLRAWASAQPEAGAMRWLEVAAAAAASVLAAHALIALAADPAASSALAVRVADAYLATCALTTLLDSLIDADADARDGGHAFLGYYAADAEVAQRLARLARDAVAAASLLPGAGHHLTIVVGAVAFYLSAIEPGNARARGLTAPMARELRPLLAPPLVIFGVWRRVKRRRALRAHGLPRGRSPAVGAVPLLG
ncbi:MAG: DUF2600 family protein [Actinobacteria bacterium]|nr:DUF2600 family protein [Actinomycetota bacterium]